MKLILTGASGYLGGLLTNYFAKQGHEVVVISRTAPNLPTGARFTKWDAETQGAWTKELEGADAVVNLAGKSVDCRYNAENRRVILESRLKSTRAVGTAIQTCAKPPKVWLNCASATIYRDARDRPMDEASGEIGSGFSVEVCKAWEAAHMEADLPNTRRVAMRLSMVFGREAPVFEVFAKLAKRGLGGQQGDGGQYVSWLHDQDFVRAVEFLIHNDDLSGPVNVCAPNPLPNRDFNRAIRKAFGLPLGLPAPKPAILIGTFLMGTEAELVLKSRRVVPTRLQDAGFEFLFPTWDVAVEDVVKATPS